jgi:hypothetical protein
MLGSGFSLIPLVKSEFFFYWDNAQQFYPLAVYLQDALSFGEIPQWWHQAGSGIPMHAQGQAALYHPIHLLFSFIFSPPVAFMLEIGCYLAIAGLSTYLFLREFHLHRTACLVGSLCQMFGSFSIVFIRNITIHRAFCLLPLAMFLAERFIARGSILYGFATSIVIGMQFLAGHPVSAIVTVIATSVYIICRILQKSWHIHDTLQQTWRQLGIAITRWGTVIALGFGVACIQIVPQLLHVDQSIRQGGLDFEYATNSLAAHLKFLPQILFPYVYKQGDWLASPVYGGSYFNAAPMMGIYVGMFPIIVVMICLCFRKRWPDPGWPLIISLILATGLSLGGETPLFPALWSLPGMHGIRYPSRFLMWTEFCLACLAALGLHKLITHSRLRRPRIRTSLPLVAIAGCVLLVSFLLWDYRASNVYVQENLHSGIVLSLILFIMAMGFAWSILYTRRFYQNAALFFTLLFVFADLMFFRLNYAPTVAIDDVMTPPPIVEFLKKDHDQFRVMSLVSWEQGSNRNEDMYEFLLPYTCTIWGIETAGDYSSLMIKRYYAIHDSIVWELLNSSSAAEKLADYLGTLNVKYVLVPKKDVTLLGWKKVFETERTIVWKNPAFMTRFYLVGNIISENIEVRDDWTDKSIKRLAHYNSIKPDWWTIRKDAQIVDNIMSNPVDYRTTAVVEGNDLPDLSNIGLRSKVIAGPQQTDAMSFEVKSLKPALLVISNNFYPGWTATVNGQPARIYRTNYVGMGILVPEGESKVILRFISPGYKIGFWISLISIVLLACLTITSFRGNKR